VLCSYAVSWKFRWGVDDSLDVVGVHLVGGVVGTLLIGMLATAAMTGGPKGLLYGGGLGQLGRQAVAVVAVGAYAFAVTYALGKGIDRLMGFRAGEEHERAGLDLTFHAETAYDHGVLTHGTPHVGTHSAAARPAVPPVSPVQARAGRGWTGDDG
jgi:ammonium transporter, Amt family